MGLNSPWGPIFWRSQAKRDSSPKKIFPPFSNGKFEKFQIPMEGKPRSLSVQWVEIRVGNELQGPLAGNAVHHVAGNHTAIWQRKYSSPPARRVSPRTLLGATGNVDYINNFVLQLCASSIAVNSGFGVVSSGSRGGPFCQLSGSSPAQAYTLPHSSLSQHCLPHPQE